MGLNRTDFTDTARVPFGKPSVAIDTPNIIDVTVVEEVPEKPENYQPLPYGTPHPDNAKTGLGLFLVWQGPVRAANNQIRVKRVYTNNNANQDWYNYALHFTSEGNAFPVYIRTYRELREGYQPLTKGTPLTGLIGLQLLAGGSGYTSDPVVAITGGGGSGAAAVAIRDLKSLEIVGLRLTSEGSGYTSPPTVAITGGGGSGATGVAELQPTNCYLVKEDVAKLDQESPNDRSLFIKVQRAYETLPGPWIETRRLDLDGVWVSVNTRRQLRSAIEELAPPETLISGVWKKNSVSEGDTVVATEVSETRAIPGNPITTTKSNEDGSVTTVTRRLEDASAIATGEFISGGVWYHVTREPVSGSGDLVAWKVVESRPVPGNTVLERKLTREFGGGILKVEATVDQPGQTPDEGYLVTDSQVRKMPGDNLLEQKVTERPEAESYEELSLTDKGTDYTSDPAVSFVGGTGAGAVATAEIGREIASLSLDNSGSGYLYPPAVVFSGGEGGGAAAVAVLGFGVSDVTVLKPGSGYTTPPAVAFSGGGGSGAAATAELGFAVGSISITNPGSGYTSRPTVEIDGDGTGAIATARIGKRVVSATVTNQGTGYTSAPTANLSGGSGSGAEVAVALDSVVASATLDTPGSGYSSAPAAAFSGGGGTGAAATVNGHKSVVSLTVDNPGSGYTTPPAVGFTGGGGSGAAATAILGFPLGGVDVLTGGSGYTTPPTVAFMFGGGGSGATAHAVLTGDVVTEIIIDTPGSGYTSPPTVALSGGGGTGATADDAYLDDTNGSIKLITLDLGGSYTGTPTVALTGGGGTGAAASANMEFFLDSITITNPGTGYTSAPAIAFSGGGGTGATATAIIGPLLVATVTNAGSGYQSAPTVALSGGGGTGAQVSVALSATYFVSGITLQAGGKNYTSPPTISLSGGGGTGATATAALASTGSVKAIALTNAGINYTSAPTVSLSGGGGSSARGRSALDGTGYVKSLTLTHAGEGYRSAPTVFFLSNSGSAAAATAVLAATGKVKSLTLNVSGSYTVAPDVVFSGGGGSGAAAIYALGSALWPKLFEATTDPVTGIVVLDTKQVVPASTRYPGSGFVDIRALEKWRSIQIVSRVDPSTLPPPELFVEMRNYSLPRVLESVEALWSKSISAEAAAGENADGEGSVRVSAQSTIVGDIIVRMTEGFSGACRVEITRTYLFGPPKLEDIDLPTIIRPVVGTAILFGNTVSHGGSLTPSSTSDSNSYQHQIAARDIGPCLSGLYTVAGTVVAATPSTSFAASPNAEVFATTTAEADPGMLEVSMPLSTPGYIPSGSVIVLPSQIERWRFGVWIVESLRLIVP